MKSNVTKIILLGLLLLLSLGNLFSQTQSVEFVYDKYSGTRITRRIITLNKSNKNDFATDKNKTTLYNDVFKNLKITIFPNPNGGKFKVRIQGLKTNQKAIVYLTTISGKIVYKQRFLSKDLDIDIQNKVNGEYILYINLDGKIKSWKIIKL